MGDFNGGESGSSWKLVKMNYYFSWRIWRITKKKLFMLDPIECPESSQGLPQGPHLRNVSWGIQMETLFYLLERERERKGKTLYTCNSIDLKFKDKQHEQLLMKVSTRAAFPARLSIKS